MTCEEKLKEWVEALQQVKQALDDGEAKRGVLGEWRCKVIEQALTNATRGLQ